MGDILNEKLTIDVDLTRPLVMRLGEKGEKGDPGEVDYNRIDVYVKNRVDQVFSPVGDRLDTIERKVDEKIELSDWQEA